MSFFKGLRAKLHRERKVFRQLATEIKMKPCEVIIHIDIALDGPDGPVVINAIGTTECKMSDLLRALESRG